MHECTLYAEKPPVLSSLSSAGVRRSKKPAGAGWGEMMGADSSARPGQMGKVVLTEHQMAAALDEVYRWDVGYDPPTEWIPAIIRAIIEAESEPGPATPGSPAPSHE